MKILLGVVSLLPIAFFALFFLWLIPAFFADDSAGGESLFSTRFDALLPLAKAMAALLLMLIVFYAVMLYRGLDVPSGEKIGIPLGILLTNGLVLPLVWSVYVWRESSVAGMSRRKGSLPVALFSLVFAAAATAAESGSVAGVVTFDGQAVPGVTVTLFDAKGTVLANEVTDIEGRFRVDGVPSQARYVVTAELAGFRTAKKRSVAVASGATTDVSLRLRALSVRERGCCWIVSHPVRRSGEFVLEADVVRKLPL